MKPPVSSSLLDAATVVIITACAEVVPWPALRMNKDSLTKIVPPSIADAPVGEKKTKRFVVRRERERVVCSNNKRRKIKASIHSFIRQDQFFLMK